MKTGKTVAGCRSVINGDIAGMRKPHFFKIIVPPLLSHGKGLRIPPKFAKEYRKRLTNPSQLKVSNGAIWEVELYKDKDNNLWLRKGWLEFVQFFSIQYGDFLVFRYEGDGSLFSVFIFDMTTAEIEYNIDHGGSMRVETDEDKRGDSSDTQMEEKDDDEEDDSDSEVQIFDGEHAIVPFEEEEVSVIQIEDDDDDHDKDEDYSDDDEVTAPENGSTIVVAKQVRVDLAAVLMEHKLGGSGVPSFIVTIPPSAVKDNFLMSIPAKHYREYLKGQAAAAEKLVFLQIADDDAEDGVLVMWRVKYTVSKAKSCASLSSGLKAFTVHHSIQVGDVCLFELLHLSPPPPLYKVTVLKKRSSL